MKTAATRLCLLAVLLCCGCSQLFFATVNLGEPPRPVETQVYASEHGLSLDVYRPVADKEPAPTMVFFFGGRWQRGSRAQYGFVGERLAARGVLAIVPDYRKYPQVKSPAFVEDAAQAVRWAHEHAAEFGGDPNHLFVAGHSAGAQMAALLGTDARYLARVGLRARDLAGVAAIAGPNDFLPSEDADLIDIFGTDPAQQEAAEPEHFVDGDEPPFLLMHGDADRLVWPGHSRRLHRQLRAAGIEATLIRYPGIGHIRVVTAIRYPRLGATLDDLMRFVERHPTRSSSTVAKPRSPATTETLTAPR